MSDERPPFRVDHRWPPPEGRVRPGCIPHIDGVGVPGDQALLALRDGEYAAPGLRPMPGRDGRPALVLDVPRGTLAAVLARAHELPLLWLTPPGAVEGGLRLLANRALVQPGRWLVAMVELGGHDPQILWSEAPLSGLAASPRVRLEVLDAWTVEVDEAAPILSELAVARRDAGTTAEQVARAREEGGRRLGDAGAGPRAAWREACAERRHDIAFARGRGLSRAEEALRLPATLAERADPTGLGHLPRPLEPAALSAARAQAAQLGALVEVPPSRARPLHGVLPELPADPEAAAAALDRAFSFLISALPPEADQ